MVVFPVFSSDGTVHSVAGAFSSEAARLAAEAAGVMRCRSVAEFAEVDAPPAERRLQPA